MFTRWIAVLAVIACLFSILGGCKPQAPTNPTTATTQSTSTSHTTDTVVSTTLNDNSQVNTANTTLEGETTTGDITLQDGGTTATDTDTSGTTGSTSVVGSGTTTATAPSGESTTASTPFGESTTASSIGGDDRTTTAATTTSGGSEQQTTSTTAPSSGTRTEEKTSGRTETTTHKPTYGSRTSTDTTATSTVTESGSTTTTTAPTPIVPAGILPGSAEAGSSFATLARAPKDEPVTVHADTKQFGRFLFTVSDNKSLPFNVACHVTKDRITALLPANADLSALKPTFSYYGHSVLYNGKAMVSRSTVMDLTKDVTLTLKANNGSTHTVTVHVETIGSDLPSFSLSTSGYATIDNTVDYKAATFSVGDSKTTVKGADCSVKGRGNTSWSYEKKSYTLRFDTKYALLGLRESKNYVLLALHADRSLLRYRLGEYLSQAMGLEFTMNSAFVDLWLNGEYQGVYALVEKIEVEPARVNITDYVSPAVPVNEMGYLLEFDKHLYNNTTEADRKKWTVLGSGFYDAATNEVFFYCEALGGHWLTVRTTNAKNLTAEHVTYIALVVETVAKALKSGDWATVSKWMDVESFVNWYLIMEYLNNTDTAMESSVYMYIDVGGKLKLGPLWDLDNCAGNHTETSSATAHPLFDSKDGWFSYLFKLPEAKKVLRTRWSAMQPVLRNVESLIDDTAASLQKAAALNFTRWPILGSTLSGQPSAIGKADTYEKQITYLKDYLAKRQTALATFYSTI